MAMIMFLTRWQRRSQKKARMCCLPIAATLHARHQIMIMRVLAWFLALESDMTIIYAMNFNPT